jgi:hypothetical protein
MPLHVPSAPAPALRSVRTALRSPTAVRGARTPAAVRTAAGPLHPELPLAIYEMPCHNGVLDRAGTRLTGWRFLLREADAEPKDGPRRGADGGTAPTGAADSADARPVGGSPVAASAVAGSPVAAEAMLTADGWAFAGFRAGPYVLAAQRALRQAESMPGTHQPRLLSVPQLYMLTLWLHQPADADAAAGSPDSGDLLIPLAPAPPGIAPHTAHRVDVLLPVLNRRLTTTSLLTGTA